MIALSVAISVWRQRVGVVNGRKRLWEAASKEPKLAKKLASELSNKRSKEAMILHRKRRKQKRKWERRKEKQASLELEREQKWISLLRNNKDRLKVGQTDTIDDLERNLYGLWHEMRGNSSDKFDKWGLSNWEVLKLKFGQAVAKAASNGFQAFWRHYTPMLPSEKNMNSVPKGLVVGLTGLSIESQKANWAHNLSIKEASLACRYAILEMNGFPEWVLDVIDAHPKAFDAVMEKQIVWEFERSSENQGHLTALYAIKNGPEVLREVYAPFLLRLLKKADPQNPVTLEYMLQILLHWVNLNTQSFALVARNRYKKSLERGRRITWLVAMMFVDANSALSSLRRWVEIKDKNKATDRMIDFCNAFFPQHNVRFNSVHRDYERIEILKKLIPLSYSHIRAEEDIIHEGVYEPNRRDDAQSVRNHFLSKVCNLPGRESYEALIHLSNVLTNKRSRDRMLVLARERAASDGDLEAWNAIDVQLFSEDAEKTPRSAQELFDLACDRLDDIKLDLEEGDSSPAQILKNVTKETDLRVWFSYILLKTSHHQYSIPPEEELADATRPDLRLHSPNIDAPIAIELKIADKWSGGELEERLQNQLVGQYLRDARSQYGIFLLVRIKKTRWKDGNSKKFLSFIDVVKRLNQIADDILKTRRDLLGIKTIGIDLAKRSTPTLMA